uniref:Nad2 n=1 Tax=Calcarina hispida TaxID=203399 RepID=UPI0023F222D8|nr:Nad2 [Calcarina hispida]WEF49982.1 Nad2 [Calcarina hispida]
MLLAIFFIIGTSVIRGSLNYIIMNAILSIGSLSSILMSNSLLLMISCYGKVGYYPFFLLLSILFYQTSYLFILFDLINKWAYYSSFTLILNVSIFFRCSEYWLVLINLVIIISSIRIISSIKHIIFISSYLLFIYLYLLLLLNNYLFSYLYLLIYISLNSILLIKCSFLYVHWIVPLLSVLKSYLSIKYSIIYPLVSINNWSLFM